MEFRRLIKLDLDSCFESRLRALENAPSAFLTTLVEEKNRGNEFFARTLECERDDKVIFGALLGKKVVGMIGLRREERPKTAHKATIWGMYVDSEQRRSGVGGKLLDIAIEHARSKMKVVAIYLSVESGNIVAKHLYESRGFNVWGVEPKAMTDEGRFFNEDHMALML